MLQPPAILGVGQTSFTKLNLPDRPVRFHVTISGGSSLLLKGGKIAPSGGRQNAHIKKFRQTYADRNDRAPDDGIRLPASAAVTAAAKQANLVADRRQSELRGLPGDVCDLVPNARDGDPGAGEHRFRPGE